MKKFENIIIMCIFLMSAGVGVALSKSITSTVEVQPKGFGDSTQFSRVVMDGCTYLAGVNVMRGGIDIIHSYSCTNHILRSGVERE